MSALSSGVVRRTRKGGGARRWVGWGFLAPFFAVFLLVLVAPVIYAIYLSFFQDRLVGGTSFVGVQNFLTAFQDAKFSEALLRVAGFMLIQVPIMLLIATVAALALDSARMYFPRFARISIFLPYAVPSVVGALLWGFMYGKQFGLVGNLSTLFGVTLPNPLAEAFILPSIGNIVTWEYLGYNMLILYAALQTVSHTLYEAADIDGASAFQVIRAIKLPAMRPAYVISIVFAVIGSFQLFNEPTLLKTMSPSAISSDFTPNMYAYTLAFSGQEYNYAAAIAIATGVLTMIIAYGIQVLGTRREDR